MEISDLIIIVPSFFRTKVVQKPLKYSFFDLVFFFFVVRRGLHMLHLVL